MAAPYFTLGHEVRTRYGVFGKGQSTPDADHIARAMNLDHALMAAGLSLDDVEMLLRWGHLPRLVQELRESLDEAARETVESVVLAFPMPKDRPIASDAALSGRIDGRAG